MIKDENDKVTCNICDAVLSRKNGRTTSLRTHLNAIDNINSLSICQTKNRRKPHELLIDKKKNLDLSILKSIIEDGRSFDDFRRPGVLKVFKHLFSSKMTSILHEIFNFIFRSPLDYVPLNGNTIQRPLSQLYFEHHRLLKNKLSKVRSIAITCDFWSDKRFDSYICLTGHYVTVIAFSSFPDRHLEQNFDNHPRETERVEYFR